MIEELFRKLGIQESEARVYLSLAELGKSPASLLAKKLEMPRSTVYSVLDSLVKRGVISVEQSQETTFFVASRPEGFRQMVKAEAAENARRLSELESAAEELIPNLEPFFKNRNFSIPKLQFFEGTKSVRAMLYEYCREWQKSIAGQDFTWWGYQDHHFVETYRDWLDYYWASMGPKEKIRLLSNRSATERKLKDRVARRVIKVIPDRYQFSSTVWVVGDYVITIMTRQKPHYAFQLKDSVFAANHRLTFQMMWDLV